MPDLPLGHGIKTMGYSVEDFQLGTDSERLFYLKEPAAIQTICENALVRFGHVIGLPSLFFLRGIICSQYSEHLRGALSAAVEKRMEDKR